MSIKRVLLSIYTVCFAVAAMAQTTETLDNGMQELARRLLYAKQGSIVAIEPSTGEIKCLVSESYSRYRKPCPGCGIFSGKYVQGCAGSYSRKRECSERKEFVFVQQRFLARQSPYRLPCPPSFAHACACHRAFLQFLFLQGFYEYD